MYSHYIQRCLQPVDNIYSDKNKDANNTFYENLTCHRVWTE